MKGHHTPKPQGTPTPRRPLPRIASHANTHAEPATHMVGQKPTGRIKFRRSH